MSTTPTSVTILIVDDDPNDRLLIQHAWRKARLHNPIDFVEDGDLVLDYLRGEGRFAEDPPTLPGLILLDLNMPRMDGHEVLAEIRDDPALKHIPVVVLTSSSAAQDIMESYGLGGNSYITKPVGFLDLVKVIQNLGDYWFELVTLPPHELT
ncbi:MAG: two-component system response regulator [Myxococcales bacterium]|nr:two-component system response regulator [Myxococcales bacterium]